MLKTLAMVKEGEETSWGKSGVLRYRNREGNGDKIYGEKNEVLHNYLKLQG